MTITPMISHSIEDPRAMLRGELQAHFMAPKYKLITVSTEDFDPTDSQLSPQWLRGLSVQWTATSFAPLSPQMMHVGFLLIDSGHIRVGLHLMKEYTSTLWRPLENFSSATGFPIIDAPDVGEFKCDSPDIPLSSTGVTQAVARALLYSSWLAAIASLHD